MTLNMDLGRDDSIEQVPLGADAQVSGAKATPPPLPADAAEAATATPLSPRALLMRMFGSMVAGCLAGVGLGVFLYPFWMSDGGEGRGISFFFICVPLALVFAGFVTGLLLSILCPRHDGRQPLQLFVCSPVVIFMSSNCLFEFFQSGTRAFSMMNSGIATLLPLTVITMCISWIGALAGWGVHTSIVKKKRRGSATHAMRMPRGSGESMNMTIEQALSRGSLTMLVRVIGPMVVGFLVGALILGWTFKIVSPLGEEGVVIAIFGTFVALICSGFICGCLLCWLLPEQNRLQPILIFFCSPAPLDAIALILFMIYKWAREEYHSPDSQPFQDFPMLMGFVLVICGVSSLAGWGIFKN